MLGLGRPAGDSPGGAPARETRAEQGIEAMVEEARESYGLTPDWTRRAVEECGSHARGVAETPVARQNLPSESGERAGRDEHSYGRDALDSTAMETPPR